MREDKTRAGNGKLLSILKKEALEHLAGMFLDQGVTGSVLAGLSDGDLRELGIAKLGERKCLWARFEAVGSAQSEPGAMVVVEGGGLPDGK